AAGDETAVEAVLRRHLRRPDDPRARVDARRLLEAQRQALLMFTSCAWFFADVAGPECTQVLRHAARAIDLARRVTGEALSPPFRAALARAASSLADVGGAARLFEGRVARAAVGPDGVTAHLALHATTRRRPRTGRLLGWRYRLDGVAAGRQGATRL